LERIDVGEQNSQLAIMLDELSHFGFGIDRAARRGCRNRRRVAHLPGSGRAAVAISVGGRMAVSVLDFGFDTKLEAVEEVAPRLVNRIRILEITLKEFFDIFGVLTLEIV